jgi:hypothetical protein
MEKDIESHQPGQIEEWKSSVSNGSAAGSVLVFEDINSKIN